MKGSINEQVWVELTKHGVKVHNEYYEKLSKVPNGVPLNPKDYRPKKDSSGCTKYELWHLMHIFGPVLTHGAMDMPFKDNTIYYSDPSM